MPPSPLSVSPHSLKSRKVRATVEKRGREEKETEDANERLHVNLNKEERGKTRFFERRRGWSANFRERPPLQFERCHFLLFQTTATYYVSKIGGEEFSHHLVSRFFWVTRNRRPRATEEEEEEERNFFGRPVLRETRKYILLLFFPKP